MDHFELTPDKDGAWSVVRRPQEGKATTVASGLASRAEALAAAQEARGDVVTELFTAEGEAHSTDTQRGPEAILLMRVDGSVYGEIEHAIVEGGPPQYVSIEPVTEAGEAVTNGG